MNEYIEDWALSPILLALRKKLKKSNFINKLIIYLDKIVKTKLKIITEKIQ